MNEPKRWIEEGPPEAVERLLHAAAAEQPPEGSLKRVLAGLGAGLGATSATAAGAAAAGGTGTAAVTGKGVMVIGAWAKWVALSVAAVGAGTAAVQSASEGGVRKPQAAATVAAQSAPVAAPVPQPVAPVHVAAPAEPVVEAAPVVARPKPVPVVQHRVATPPEDEAPVDAEKLAEEVRVVDRARSALAAGGATEALAALDEYDARMAPRRFQPEALYLRMQAQLALGRKAEARSTAARLVKSFPQSPHTARARRVLEAIP